MEGYKTIKEISEIWDITPRRIEKLCADGLIPGASKFGNTWAIPIDTKKPTDRRKEKGKRKVKKA